MSLKKYGLVLGAGVALAAVLGFLRKRDGVGRATASEGVDGDDWVMLSKDELATAERERPRSRCTRTAFGKVGDQDVDLFTLVNENGAVAKVMTWGATLTELHMPDRKGFLNDVVLGYESIDGYLKNPPYFGCIVGRLSNRVGGARFTLDGQDVRLTPNEGRNQLHGGPVGFNSRLWEVVSYGDGEHNPSVTLRLQSENGDQGYPGKLTTDVTYVLTGDNELRIHMSATSDATTVCSLASHSYFNLKGQGAGDVLAHQLLINAHKYTPCDNENIPTGAIREVRGTPLDFTSMHPIGERISELEHQPTKGYDHNFVLDADNEQKKDDTELTLAASVFEPTSGRSMEVYTNAPGVQLYTGNYLNNTIVGKKGKTYPQFGGFCLETQHFPDSPNQPAFPSVVLRKGDKYVHKMVYRFSA